MKTMKTSIYLIFTFTLFLGCRETQPPTALDQTSEISSGTSNINSQSNAGTSSTSNGASPIALENYEAYRQLVIQNIVEKTGDRRDNDFDHEVHGSLVPGNAQENNIAVEATLQSVFDEHEGFLQTLFARQTDSEFLPYIQKYENIKGDALRPGLKIFFSDRLQETIIEEADRESQEQQEHAYFPTEINEWEQQEKLRHRQHEQQVIGDFDFAKIENGGACLLWYSVFIDRDVWQMLSEEEKEIVLFHEIGHCDLYRHHSADEPSIMVTGWIEWIFLVTRNPSLTLQRNNNYDNRMNGIDNQNPMCLCNESGECSNKYCIDENYEDESIYQSLIDIAKSGNFEPLYQELFSKNIQYNTNVQVEALTTHSKIIEEISKEPHF